MSTTREESLLNAIAEGSASGVKPYTREEKFLAYIAGETTEKPIAYTRKEKLLEKIAENGVGGGGGSAKEEQEKSITITENGTTEVTPDEGKTLSKVTVTASILDGEVGKPYIDTSKITDFQYFGYTNRIARLVDNCDFSNGVNFDYAFQASNTYTKLTINSTKIVRMRSMFSGCRVLTAIYGLYTENNTDFYSTFENCEKLVTIGTENFLDISNGTTFSYTFKNCKALETLTLTTAKTDFRTDTLQGCTALTNLTIGEGWAVSIYLTYSNNLSVESLHGMIENLADLTGKTAKTFSVGATNLAKIDEEHIAMLNAKNWAYS